MIEMVVGTKREPIGQTPLSYRAEFHSEISVLRFSARKPGYVARDFEVTGKDDRVMIQLQERSFATSPAELNDPELRKMQEQMVVATEKVIRDALKEQSPFEVDLARKIEVQRIDDSAYLVVPVSVGHAPADYRRVGAGNAQAFLADLWGQLGDGFALPLVQAARKVKGINGIVLDVDYSHVQSGFGVGFRMESNVEMECQPGTKMQFLYDSCATRQTEQTYNAQTHDWESSGTKCVGGLVTRQVFDPCASRVPMTHTTLVTDPTVSFAQAKSKARYFGSLEAFGTAVHANDVYERIGAVLTDNNGGVLARHGDLRASLVPARRYGAELTPATASTLAMLGKNVQSVEVKTWLEKVGASPEIDKFDDCYYYSFKATGVSLSFDKATDVLTSIFLYSEGADEFRQYQGDLPFGLSFQMTRKEIESALGRPDESGGDGVINFWVGYKSEGIGITYDRLDPKDMAARIHDLNVSLGK